MIAGFPVGAELLSPQPDETTHAHMQRIEELLVAQGYLPPPGSPSPQGTPERDESGKPHLSLVVAEPPDVHSAEGLAGQGGSPVRHFHDSPRVSGAAADGRSSHPTNPWSAEKGAESA